MGPQSGLCKIVWTHLVSKLSRALTSESLGEPLALELGYLLHLPDPRHMVPGKAVLCAAASDKARMDAACCLVCLGIQEP